MQQQQEEGNQSNAKRKRNWSGASVAKNPNLMQKGNKLSNHQ